MTCSLYLDDDLFVVLGQVRGGSVFMMLSHLSYISLSLSISLGDILTCLQYC